MFSNRLLLQRQAISYWAKTHWDQVRTAAALNLLSPLSRRSSLLGIYLLRIRDRRTSQEDVASCVKFYLLCIRGELRLVFELA